MSKVCNCCHCEKIFKPVRGTFYKKSRAFLFNAIIVFGTVQLISFNIAFIIGFTEGFLKSCRAASKRIEQKQKPYWDFQEIK